MPPSHHEVCMKGLHGLSEILRMPVQATRAAPTSPSCPWAASSSASSTSSAPSATSGALETSISRFLLACRYSCSVPTASEPGIGPQPLYECMLSGRLHLLFGPTLLILLLCMHAGLTSPTGSPPLLPPPPPHGRATCWAPCSGSASPSRSPQARRRCLMSQFDQLRFF